MMKGDKLTAGVYIPDENRKLHTLGEWRQREDPTTADGVVLVMDFYGHLVAIKVAKRDIEGCYNFDIAQAAAAALGAGWRPFSVHEGVELYRAKHLHGLNEALREVGGDPICDNCEVSYWTCDDDADTKGSAAFSLYMEDGTVILSYKLNQRRVRMVSDFSLPL